MVPRQKPLKVNMSTISQLLVEYSKKKILYSQRLQESLFPLTVVMTSEGGLTVGASVSLLCISNPPIQVMRGNSVTYKIKDKQVELKGFSNMTNEMKLMALYNLLINNYINYITMLYNYILIILTNIIIIYIN